MDNRLTIKIPEKYVIHYIDSDDIDPQLMAYKENLLSWKDECEMKRIPIYIHIMCSPMIPMEVYHFLMLMGKVDCHVENYDPFVRVLAANYNDEVPEGLPHREDEEGNVRTWKTWRSEGHEETQPNPIDGNFYFRSSRFGNPLKDTELILIHNSEGVGLINDKDKPIEEQIL